MTNTRDNVSVLGKAFASDRDSSSNVRLWFDTVVTAADIAAGTETVLYVAGEIHDHLDDTFSARIAAFSDTRVFYASLERGDLNGRSDDPSIEAPRLRVFARSSLSALEVVPTKSVFSSRMFDEQRLSVTAIYGDLRVDLPGGVIPALWQHKELEAFLPSLLDDLS